MENINITHYLFGTFVISLMMISIGSNRIGASDRNLGWKDMFLEIGIVGSGLSAILYLVL